MKITQSIMVDLIHKHLNTDEYKIKKKDIHNVLEAFKLTVESALKAGNSVEIIDLAIFELHITKARNARNPQNEDIVFLEERTRAHVRLSQAFKKRIIKHFKHI